MPQPRLLFCVLGLMAAACSSGSSGAVCVVGGTSYHVGQSYTEPGGCGNMCTCMEDGTSACDKVCPASPISDSGAEGGDGGACEFLPAPSECATTCSGGTACCRLGGDRVSNLDGGQAPSDYGCTSLVEGCCPEPAI